MAPRVQDLSIMVRLSVGGERFSRTDSHLPDASLPLLPSAVFLVGKGFEWQSLAWLLLTPAVLVVPALRDYV